MEVSIVINEQTTQLLERLATKLGTTSEHLWGILLHQAPLSSIVDLIASPFVIYICYRLSGIGFRMWKDVDDPEEIGILLCVPASIIGVIVCFCFILSLDRIIAGIVNPEYWALSQILDNLKRCK